MTPYIEPRFTAIVSSADGISWQVNRTQFLGQF
jgi:hypothetical protein